MSQKSNIEAQRARPDSHRSNFSHVSNSSALSRYGPMESKANDLKVIATKIKLNQRESKICLGRAIDRQPSHLSLSQQQYQWVTPKYAAPSTN